MVLVFFWNMEIMKENIYNKSVVIVLVKIIKKGGGGKHVKTVYQLKVKNTFENFFC